MAATRSVQSEPATEIDLTRPYEEEFWCLMLGVDAQRLRAAIDAVGPAVDKVSIYLLKAAEGSGARQA